MLPASVGSHSARWSIAKAGRKADAQRAVVV